VRKLCSYCKRPLTPTPQIRELFARQGLPLEKDGKPIFMASGCSECSGTGYTGRIALIEMTEMNTELADLVERQASQTELRAAARKSGYQTHYQESLLQVLSGDTTLDEIQKVSYTAY